MRRRLREHLHRRVLRDLEPRARDFADLRAGVADLGRRVAGARDTLARVDAVVTQLQAVLRPRRFTSDLTVHAAWALHPGVEGIFAGHGLPACPACAVGADETLAEAAFGYALDLEDLLARLNALLPE